MSCPHREIFSCDDCIKESIRNSPIGPSLAERLREAKAQLDKADQIILDIHAQITAYSKYTASKVYEWKDLRGKDGSQELKEFDDDGRDE